MKKRITQTLLPIIMGLSVITQFACSDDNKSGSNYNGPLKLTTFYPDSGYLSSKIIITIAKSKNSRPKNKMCH